MLAAIDGYGQCTDGALRFGTVADAIALFLFETVKYRGMKCQLYFK